MTNLERRGILDDISGITKFDEDIQSAEKEKLTAEENIGRLSIIHDQLNKQMKQLDADREGALKYKDLHDRLVIAQACVVMKRKESVDREMSSIGEQITNYTDGRRNPRPRRQNWQRSSRTSPQS